MKMTNLILIVAAVLITFAIKCVKEIVDVRKMAVMAPQERHDVIERRHFYDNHA